MKDRIKKVREDASLTQKAFGDRLGLSMNYVYLMETGRKNPSQATIREICRQFAVREDWLRNGAGEPYRDLTPAMEAADKVRRLMVDAPTSTPAVVISTLLEMDPMGAEWEAIGTVLNRILDKNK